jgi:hypothetical protein
MTDTGQLDDESPIAAYKAILLSVLDSRPSGTRQRLAEALGKNRSFISQIVSANYPTPIPAQHIKTIFSICRFTPQDRKAFLVAYGRAHPGRLDTGQPPQRSRKITVELPDLGSAALNAQADELIQSIARGIAGLVASTGKDDSETTGAGP